jgi:hypothetical protein
MKNKDGEYRYRTSVVWRRDRLDDKRITFGVGYNGLHKLEKLDFLRDLMAAIEEQYQTELAVNGEAYKKPVNIKRY